MVVFLYVPHQNVVLNGYIKKSSPKIIIRKTTPFDIEFYL